MGLYTHTHTHTHTSGLVNNKINKVELNRVRIKRENLELARENGITLIALVITIIVLLILAGISISMLTGDNSILKNAQTAKTETIRTSEEEKIKIALAGAYSSDGTFNSEAFIKDLENLGVEFDAISDKNIIVKTADGKQMIVSKETGTMNNITTDEDKVQLAISNATDSNGNFNSDKFKEELAKLGVTAGAEEIPVQTVGKDSITATLDGKVIVKYEDGTTREVGKTSNTATLDTGWTKTDELNSKNAWYNYNGQTVNMPKLKGNMIGVKYTTTTGNRWANAVTSDGSMWVWIPRFAYRIISNGAGSGYHQSTAGTVEIIFLDTANQPLNSADKGKTIVTDPDAITYTGNSQNQFLVHPAFTANAENGGGFGEISGFWFAKFEASGSLTALKSEAGVTSLRNTTIGDFFTRAKTQKYGETVDLQSHLIKNSEWGAVVFLTKSLAGTPNVAVAQNAKDGYFTGGIDSSSENKALVYTANVNQSTTQNAYGIYDMNGGTWEYVASYVDNKHDDIVTYGGEMATNRTSNKYYTVYKSNNTTGSDDGKYQAEDYEKNKGMKGDAVYETSSAASEVTAWWSATSYFPYSDMPVFVRGGGNGWYNNGIFTFSLGGAYGSINHATRLALVL